MFLKEKKMQSIILKSEKLHYNERLNSLKQKDMTDFV